MDVKSAYLYGKVDKEIYRAQSTGYKIKGKEGYVLKLNKALYGLYQAVRCWFEKLHIKLLNSFEDITGLTCAYHYKHKAVILVYVDGLPIFAETKSILQEVINLLQSAVKLFEHLR